MFQRLSVVVRSRMITTTALQQQHRGWRFTTTTTTTSSSSQRSIRFLSTGPFPPPPSSSSSTTNNGGSSGGDDQSPSTKSPSPTATHKRYIPTPEELAQVMTKDTDYVSALKNFNPIVMSVPATSEAERHAALPPSPPSPPSSAAQPVPSSRQSLGQLAVAPPRGGFGYGGARDSDTPILKPSYRGRTSRGVSDVQSLIPGRLTSAATVAMFSLHAKQPHYWTAARLAERFRLPSAELVTELLSTAAAPYVHFSESDHQYVGTHYPVSLDSPTSTMDILGEEEAAAGGGMRAVPTPAASASSKTAKNKPHIQSDPFASPSPVGGGGGLGDNEIMTYADFLPLAVRR